MAYFTTIQTSTCITMSVDLVGRQSFLALFQEPQILMLPLRSRLACLPKVADLEDPLKSALAFLGCPHDFMVLETPLLLLATKLP
jgi:hypothetical protein